MASIVSEAYTSIPAPDLATSLLLAIWDIFRNRTHRNRARHLSLLLTCAALGVQGKQ